MSIRKVNCNLCFVDKTKEKIGHSSSNIMLMKTRMKILHNSNYFKPLQTLSLF